MRIPTRQRALHIALTIGSLMIAFPSFAGAANAQNASFPGRVAKSKSPDSRYVIENVDYDNRDPAHDLVLLDTKNGSKTTIQSYERGVDVLWSPQSDAFVVNDHEGSDSTRPLLYSLPWTGNKTDLLGKLTDFLRTRHQEQLVLGNDHVYFSVRRWISARELLGRLEAYGEANPHGSGFNGYYVYTVGQGFRLYSSKLQNR
jgi:hypothetical protein